jgi:hypothetical protein
MKQKMSDIPKTKAEEDRQRGRIPLIAIFLALGLFAAWALFAFPAFQSGAFQATSDVWQDPNQNPPAPPQ